ncbi:MAG TPA: DNA polymerase III subunit gamma/tau [Phycisphaerae bacterium]|nr:DNA polymerase III subunit gamma/tau [Phycisphaerae bacterium]
MAYTVLARRYRPQTFDEVIGQEAVARTLKNAIASDRVAHAYLFTGTRGVGKTTMARILAKALNCQKGPTADPCGKCDSCKRVLGGDDLDVIEIDGASNTGVDSVRELRANAIYAPARSRFKIYIIDEVHMLSTGAFNALLKTLEEPPEHVKFIFATTDPQKVPNTIHSRCQRFDFRSVPAEVVAEYLGALCRKEKVKADKEALQIIAREGRGSVRDALTLLDQAITLCEGDVQVGPVLESLGLTVSRRFFEVLDALAAHDVPQTLKLLDAALNEGLECGEFADHLLDHLRSLLLVKIAGPEAPGLETTAEERKGLVQQAGKFTEDHLTLALELAGETRQRLRNLPHGRPLVELALIQLARMPDFDAIGAALDRLRSAMANGGSASASAPVPAAAPVEKKKSEPLSDPDESPPGDDYDDPGPEADAPAEAPRTRSFARDFQRVGDGEPADERPQPTSVGAAPPAAAAPTAPALRPLTQAEQQEIKSDPKVQRILSLFEGEIIDMGRGEARRED